VQVPQFTLHIEIVLFPWFWEVLIVLGVWSQLRIELDKIFRKLDIIDAKVSVMPQVQISVNNRYLPTLNALHKLGGCGYATQVAEVTGRARAHESSNLNTLAQMGVVERKRLGKTVFFTLKPEAMPK